MMPQSIGRKYNIFFYIFIFIFLSTINNISWNNKLDSILKIKKVEVTGLDNDLNQPCSGFSPSYVYNPIDPMWSGNINSGGNHNHKAYSVHIEGNEIWVGTASGVNKGSISGVCIDWTNHYNIDIKALNNKNPQSILLLKLS